MAFRKSYQAREGGNSGKSSSQSQLSEICPVYSYSLYKSLPSINGGKILCRTSLAVLLLKICRNPCDKVIFKCPLDDLVEEIGRHQFIDISIREIIGKGLIYVRKY